MNFTKTSKNFPTQSLGCTQPKTQRPAQKFVPTLIATSGSPSADDLRRQSEALLETCITQAFTQLINAPTIEWRMAAWEEFAALIRQRSPEHVARLEQEKWDRVRADYGQRAVRA